jgi:hypothetical protein
MLGQVLERLLQRLERLLVAADLAEDVAKAGDVGDRRPGFPELGVERQRLVDAGDCLLGAPLVRAEEPDAAQRIALGGAVGELAAEAERRA